MKSIDFFKKNFNYVQFVHVCALAHSDQKRALEPLKLKL